MIPCPTPELVAAALHPRPPYKRADVRQSEWAVATALTIDASYAMIDCMSPRADIPRYREGLRLASWLLNLALAP